MATLSISVDGGREFTELMERQERAVRDRVLRKIIQTAASRVQRLAVTEYIIRGTREAAPDPRRLTSRSAAAGILGRIITDFRDLPGSASVIADVVYGGVHEFGWPEKNIPARPYLGPAKDDVDEQMGEIMDQILRSELP